MNIIAPNRRFDPDEPEMIDQPGMDPALLSEELQMLGRMNRVGGHQLVLEYVKCLLGSHPKRNISILDLGTGFADVPRAIAEWARREGLTITITAVDTNGNVLQIAEEHSRDCPEIQFARHDMRSLPYEAGSFDIVLCSLALHHFDAADAVAVLRRIHELARVGYMVNDLRRNWGSIWLTELLALTLLRSNIVRHDAPQSCRAAFTLRELQNLASQAGLTNYQIRRHQLLFRMVLSGRK